MKFALTAATYLLAMRASAHQAIHVPVQASYRLVTQVPDTPPNHWLFVGLRKLLAHGFLVSETGPYLHHRWSLSRDEVGALLARAYKNTEAVLAEIESQIKSINGRLDAVQQLPAAERAKAIEKIKSQLSEVDHSAWHIGDIKQDLPFLHRTTRMFSAELRALGLDPKVMQANIDLWTPRNKNLDFKTPFESGRMRLTDLGDLFGG